MNRSAREDGFTLVELLVSLAILAVALGVLFSTISSALDRTRKDRGDTLAGSLVQSLLARAGTERPLRTGTREGTYSNGMHWTVAVTPYGTGDDAKAWPVAAFVIRASVTWADGAQTHTKFLSTLRLQPPAKRHES